jgi:hypothetical protein
MPRDGTSLDLGTDLAHALNAAIFAEDRLGFVRTIGRRTCCGRRQCRSLSAWRARRERARQQP